MTEELRDEEIDQVINNNNNNDFQDSIQNNS